MRVHLLVNIHRQDAIGAAQRAAMFLRLQDVDVRAHVDSASVLNLDSVDESEFGGCDLAITFGGDGTLIRGAHLCSETSAPILGVYYGRFGFVTQCTGEVLEECLQQFVRGEAEFETRMMIQTDLIRNGAVIASIHSLNEMVVQRAVTVRMLTFGVDVNGHHLTSYPADGVMISTATGSTGYNLSAGGPIMDPNVAALVITAIAPHTLSSRTLVLHDSSIIQLSMKTEGDSVLSADGQTRLHLLSGDILEVKKSKRVTRLMTVTKDDFLIKLGQRLFWSQQMFGDES